MIKIKEDCITRREFTKGCLCALLTIPFCDLSCKHILNLDQSEQNKNYYINNINKIQKLIDEYRPILEEVLEEYMTKQDAILFMKKSIADFKDFLPKLPYIGGDENPYTFSLASGAFQMKYMDLLHKKGFSFCQCGKIGYDIVDKYFNRMSWIKKWFMSNFIISENKYKKMAKRKIYSAYDWKIDFVEGNNSDFDFGFNVRQCGLVKLYAENGMSDFLPFVCIQDFASIKPFNVRLLRSEVLSRGGVKCDFRYKKNAASIQGWPPEKLPEFKNNKCS